MRQTCRMRECVEGKLSGAWGASTVATELKVPAAMRACSCRIVASLNLSGPDADPALVVTR